MFEKKGVATDRLKTEEEIAKAELVRIDNFGTDIVSDSFIRSA